MTTETAAPSPPKQPWWPCANLIVSLRSDGLQMQQQQTAPNRPVDLAGAVALSKLSGEGVAYPAAMQKRVIAAHGGDVDQLDLLVRSARRGHRIVQDAEPPAPLGPTSPIAWSLDDGPFADVPARADLLLPIVFRTFAGRFETFDHDGELTLRLDPFELLALSEVVTHPDIADAHAAHVRTAGAHAITRERFQQILGRLAAAGILTDEGGGTPRIEIVQGLIRNEGSTRRLRDAFRAQARELDAAEEARSQASGRPTRTKVIPVAFDTCPPAGLASCVAYAKAYDGGKLDDFYDFRVDWVWDDERLDGFTSEPAIYVCSNYMWSHAQTIAVSAVVKERSPNSVTIHGGPDTPKYERDCKDYFAQYPHVDVTVRGEGELTMAVVLEALTKVIGDDEPDLSVLAGVEGISYRGPDGTPIHNPDRERIADLSTIPSPLLTGLFDAYRDATDVLFILESNRGCPYGCTFCDWGSATASRIRKFDMERVLGELDWCSEFHAAGVSIADANFGIFPRDVELAQRVADLKTTTGYPTSFGGNYAKNTVKHLREIVTVLAGAGILTQGTLSLQSMDEVTLDTIHRSNIKTEKYDALAKEMRDASLPLTIELMMGLPGSTVQSFTDDLQQCIDRELPARINHTVLLVNSPMNEPQYLAEHQIETSVHIGPGNLASLRSTRSYSEEDLTEMERIRQDFHHFDTFGVLRVISRFVRQASGLREMEFYARLRAETTDATVWPALACLLELGSSMMAPPVSWAFVVDELHRFAVDEIGVADDTALETALRAQLALLPAHGRTFPLEVELPHDIGSWWLAMLLVKDGPDRAAWTDAVPSLATFGPGVLTVEDPREICRSSIGINNEISSFGINWELDSDLGRARADVNAW